MTNEAIESDFPYSYDTDRSTANRGIRSVALDICMRYGVTGILGIGHGALSICLDLNKAGYAAAMINPDENSMASPVEFASPDRFYYSITEFDHSRIKKENFNIAVIVESGKLFSNLSTLIQFAGLKLESGSIVLISIPCHGYLKIWLKTMKKWWILFHAGASYYNSIHLCSVKNMTAFLALNGFKVIEFIGIHGGSLTVKNLIFVARKA